MKTLTLPMYFGIVVTGVSAFFLVCAFLLWDASSQLNGTVATMRQSSELLSKLQILRRDISIFRRQALLRGIIPTRDRLALEKQSEASIRQDLENLRLLDAQIGVTAETQAVVKSVGTFLSEWDKLRSRDTHGSEVYKQTLDLFEQVDSDLQELMNSDLDRVKAAHSAGIGASRLYKRGALISVFLIGCCVFLLLFSFRRLIYTPIRSFAQAVRSFPLNTGNIDVMQGSIVEINAIWTAFSDLKSRLDRQAKERLTFMASVVHDLLNPLSALSMALEIIEADDLSPRQRHELIGVARRQIANLQALLQDLSLRARTDAGEFSLKVARYNIVELAEDALKLFSKGSSKHSFQFSAPENGLDIACDGARLSQVLNNLLTNTIKYSPDGGRISVKVGKHADCVSLSVSDEGIGVDPQELASIFNPFQRGKGNLRNIKGTGLGLSSCKRVVEAHGGTIEVRKGDALGSIFTVKLPCWPPNLNPNLAAHQI